MSSTQITPALRRGGEDVTLTVERNRNTIEFSDGRYMMFPKDGPLLGGARFSVTFSREGSRDVSHFIRAISVEGIDLADVVARRTQRAESGQRLSALLA
jgi:hypothetical protein